MLVKDYGGEIDWNIGAFCGHDEMMFDIDKACKMACEKNGIRYVLAASLQSCRVVVSHPSEICLCQKFCPEQINITSSSWSSSDILKSICHTRRSR